MDELGMVMPASVFSLKYICNGKGKDNVFNNELMKDPQRRATIQCIHHPRKRKRLKKQIRDGGSESGSYPSGCFTVILGSCDEFWLTELQRISR